MKRKIVFMFSGQGSQQYLMGKDLYEKNFFFRDYIDWLDFEHKQLTGDSIVPKIYEKELDREAFSKTKFTHPAIFMFQFALAETLIKEGLRPDFVLGTSLGEFVAASVAGVLEPKIALKMVVDQAYCITETCKLGSMLAILGSDSIFREIAKFDETVGLVAKYSDQHFIISCSRNCLEEIKSYLKYSKTYNVELPVTHGFHSVSIDAAYDSFYSLICKQKFKKPKLGWLSSACGCQIKNEPLPDFFWKVVRNPILFNEVIDQFDKEYDSEANYLDLGASGSLANILKNSKGFNLKQIHYGFDRLQGNNENIARLKEKLSMKNEELNNIGKKAFLFPGQGSQIKGMGKEYFSNNHHLLEKAKKILGYSVENLCINNPDNQLSQTQFTQPALYVVNCLTYLNTIKDHKKPDYVAGHSLGEYCALFASEVIDFETGLRLVKKRGELMSQAKEGGMAAIIGMKESQIRDILFTKEMDFISVANINAPDQIVISGPKQHILNAQSVFEKAGCKLYVKLNVSGAFHSKLMKEAKDEFEDYLNKYSFNNPKIPIISNVTAEPYQEGKIKKLLANQITSSVKWVDTIKYLISHDVSDFKEIGPGNVLQKLLDKIRNNVELTPLKPQVNLGVQLVSNLEKIELSERKKESKIVENNDAINRNLEDSLHLNWNKKFNINGMNLGSKSFRKDYNLKYAYVSGSMVHGIASKELVVKMGKAGLLSFFGTGGLTLEEIESSIIYIQEQLKEGESYGFNLLNGTRESDIIDLMLKYEVPIIEASAFMDVNQEIIRYKLNGLSLQKDGNIAIKNRIIAKISRPEVASLFLSPPPERIINELLAQGKISKEQADLGSSISVADDLTVEADSGGHTDQGMISSLLPTIIKQRDNYMKSNNCLNYVRVGAAGGIGTPEAAAAAFILGADYILTGSINQCTVESGAHPEVKTMLQDINVQDTDYAPAGDMFEMGAKIQVLKKGVFFSARANKLYELYKHFNSIEEIDQKTKTRIEEKYFKRSFDQVYKDVVQYYSPEEINRAERNPKQKMAYIFRWYFGYSTQLALQGKIENKVDFQIHCGPALGAFNQWVKGTKMENWQNRHVDEIAEKIMSGAAEIIETKIMTLIDDKSR